MPLVHLPVQSGSDKILDLMNRKNTINQYIEVFEKIKNINSKIVVYSEYLIEYPGQDEKEFKQKFELIKNIK